MRSATYRDFSVVALTAGLGLVVAALAIPRLVAEFVSLPGESPLVDLQNGDAVAESPLELLIETRNHALKWVDSGRTYTDLALAHLVLAETKAGYGALDREHLLRAIDLLHQGLALAPSRPFAWARLAFARYVADGPSDAVGRALEMSIRTGPHEPYLCDIRLELALATWDHLSVEAQQLSHEDIWIAWSLSREAVAALAYDLNRPDVIRAAFATSSEDLVAFELIWNDIQTQYEINES